MTRKMLFKGIIVSLMITLLCGAIFAGGAKDGGTAGAGGPVTVKYLMPGDAPLLYDEVIAVVNQKLQADKNIKIEIGYIPWDAWQQRVNLMLTTGEEFDLFHIMQDVVLMSSYQGMGGLTDITDILDQHGPNLKKAITPGGFDALRINGRIYGVPAQWAELSAEGVVTARLDVMKKYGITSFPKTPDELLSVMETVASKWDGSGKLYFPLAGSIQANPVTSGSTTLHRTYDSFPFTVQDATFFVDKNGNVKSWIETEEFKKDAQFFRKAYEKGLLNPDILSMQQDQVSNLLRSGNWLFAFGCKGYYEDIKRNNNPNLTQDDISGFKFNADKPDIYYTAVKNLNGISSTSKHPIEAIKFLDWLYTSKENYNLFMYGRQGIDYTLNASNLRETKRDSSDRTLYEQADWMVGNINYIIPGTATLPHEIKWLYTLNPKAVNFPGCDFFFNASTVEAEWANVQTEFYASIAPIYLGVLSYDQAFPAALRRMKTAGLDKVVAEYQRQLKIHLSSK